MTRGPAVRELIADMESAGIRLWEEEGQLRFRAPKGALTEDRRTALLDAKPEIIDQLRRESAAQTA
uniref:TubC N-terminal docking domain-related protein n=1 Tax=Nonomuraea rhizosphaerae TaxID=2665663 RepID=UPI001C5F9B52